MGLFGFGRTEGRWLKHSHLFRSDSFECSECGRIFNDAPSECPKCGCIMTGIADAFEFQKEQEALEEEYDEIDGIEDADY
ncbi:MAG: hypothetical protein J5685_08965 [Clostridiales bacterium]|nr:hypothetical protein [Clostridiales bacterium]